MSVLIFALAAAQAAATQPVASQPTVPQSITEPVTAPAPVVAPSPVATVTPAPPTTHKPITLWRNIEDGMTVAQLRALYPQGPNVTYKDDRTILADVPVIEGCQAKVNVMHPGGAVKEIVMRLDAPSSVVTAEP